MNNSENKYFMKKNIRSKNVAYKKTKKNTGFKISLDPILTE